MARGAPHDFRGRIVRHGGIAPSSHRASTTRHTLRGILGDGRRRVLHVWERIDWLVSAILTGRRMNGWDPRTVRASRDSSTSCVSSQTMAVPYSVQPGP